MTRRSQQGRAWLILSFCLLLGTRGAGECQPARPADAVLEAGRRALKDREAEVEELADRVTDGTAMPGGPKAAAQAMLILGWLRAIDALPALARQWSFDFPLRYSLWPQNSVAVFAAGQVGLPALRTFIEMAARGRSMSETQILGAMGPPAIIRGAMERAAERETDARRRAKLREAASLIEPLSELAHFRAFCAQVLEDSLKWPTPLDPVIAKAKGVADECDAAVKGLSDWLLSVDDLGDAAPDTQEAAVEAMELLGEFRFPEGIPGLAKHWDYVQPGAKGDKLSDYPALAALGEIDFPALDVLIGIAADGKDGKAITWPLTEVFAKLGPGDAVAEVVEAAAKKQIDPDRYKRLMATAAAVREQESAQP